MVVSAMVTGDRVEIGANDCAVPAGTVGLWLGEVSETGNALVLLPGGRRVALLAGQWRPEGGEWPVLRLAADPEDDAAAARNRGGRKPLAAARICTVPGCGRPHDARGLCAYHYGRESRASALSGICKVPGCGRPVEARGWCNPHYQRWKRTGSVQASLPVGQGVAS